MMVSPALMPDLAALPDTPCAAKQYRQQIIELNEAWLDCNCRMCTAVQASTRQYSICVDGVKGSSCSETADTPNETQTQHASKLKRGLDEDTC